MKKHTKYLLILLTVIFTNNNCDQRMVRHFLVRGLVYLQQYLKEWPEWHIKDLFGKSKEEVYQIIETNYSSPRAVYIPRKLHAGPLNKKIEFVYTEINLVPDELYQDRKIDGNYRYFIYLPDIVSKVAKYVKKNNLVENLKEIVLQNDIKYLICSGDAELKKLADRFVLYINCLINKKDITDTISNEMGDWYRNFYDDNLNHTLGIICGVNKDSGETFSDLPDIIFDEIPLKDFKKAVVNILALWEILYFNEFRNLYFNR